jgi:hypothetical protein
MGALSSPDHPIALNIVDSKGSWEMPKASDLLLQTVHKNKNKGDIDIPEEFLHFLPLRLFPRGSFHRQPRFFSMPWISQGCHE